MTQKKQRKKLMAVEIPNVQQLQLELFPPTEMEILTQHVREVKQSADKVRKGVFAKHGSLAKKVDELECKINELQAQMMNLGSLVMSVTNAPNESDGNQKTESQPIILEHADFAENKKKSRRREIITDLYQLELFEECK